MLLLRPELKDSEIPHRTKLRADIVKSWATWFSDLKVELSVRSPIHLLMKFDTESVGRTLWGR